MPKTEAVISKIVQETPNVKSFYVKSSTKIPYKNGQHLIIFKQDGKYHVGRPYSMTTTSDEEELGFCIKHYPKGKLSSYMFGRKEGDKLLLSQAFGRLKIHDKTKPMVFMATGTGIAPVMSMLKEMFNNKCQVRVHLLFGVVTEKDIIYESQLWQWHKERNDFFFVPCLSAPSKQWKGRTGYVQQNLDAVPNWIENDFYLVGIHAMVEECKRILLEAGIPHEQIFSETE